MGVVLVRSTHINTTDEETSHHFPKRRRARRESEMVHLLILLIIPALGRPSSDQPDVGAEINNQLDDLVKFSHETGKLLNNTKLFGKVAETLQEADQSILDMEAELNKLQSKVPALQDKGNYFPGYVKAKSFLRQTRQELRELAHRTVKEVDIMTTLLDDHDKIKIPFLLEAAIQRMKLLIDETKEKLDKAKNKYKEARSAFENLRSSVAVQHEILGKEIIARQAKLEQYEKDKEYTETVRFNCKIASWFTFGLCSLIHHYVNEVPLEEARVDLENLNALTPRFLERALALTQDIDNAVGEMDKEIDLINKWAVSAHRVNQNIKDHPVEFLRVYEALRTNFKRGLVDLKMNAQHFLDL